MSQEREWWWSAACADMDTDIFFNVTGNPLLPRSVCAVCPVRAECLADAMRYESRESNKQFRFGMFGGLLPGERRELHEHLIKGNQHH